MMGSDPTDVISMKRWLAFLEGGLLPVISLTSLHFFVKYESNNTVKGTVNEIVNEETTEDNDNEYPEPNEKIINAKKVWEKVNELRQEGKLPEPPTEEELAEEPTSLAFTPYDTQEMEEEIEEEVELTENTKFPIDRMLEFDDIMTTTTTTDDGIRRLSYVKNT